MAQWVKWLPHKPYSMSSNPQSFSVIVYNSSPYTEIKGTDSRAVCRQLVGHLAWRMHRKSNRPYIKQSGN